MVRWGRYACGIRHIGGTSGVSDELAGGRSPNTVTGGKRHLYGCKWSLPCGWSGTWTDCRAFVFLLSGWYGRTAGRTGVKSRELSWFPRTAFRDAFYEGGRGTACRPHGSGSSSVENGSEKIGFPFCYAERGAAGRTWKPALREADISDSRPCGHQKRGFYHAGWNWPQARQGKRLFTWFVPYLWVFQRGTWQQRSSRFFEKRIRYRRKFPCTCRLRPQLGRSWF